MTESGSRSSAVSLAIATLLALVIAVVGGYLCGLAIDRWGQFGSLALG